MRTLATIDPTALALLARLNAKHEAAARQPLPVPHRKPGASWAFVASSAYGCSLCGSDTCRSHACLRGATL